MGREPKESSLVLCGNFVLGGTGKVEGRPSAAGFGSPGNRGFELDGAGQWLIDDVFHRDRIRVLGKEPTEERRIGSSAISEEEVSKWKEW